MSSSLGAWGVPDFGATVHRDRIRLLLSRGGTRPAVVTGPSGCGKSIAAAHCSQADGHVPVWVDACQEFLTADRVALSILAALGGESPIVGGVNPVESQLVDLIDATLSAVERFSGGVGVCVVIDDCGRTETASAIRDLGWLARSLRRCSSRMLVTTRSISDWPLDMLCDWEIVDQSDLALTLEEAEDFLRCTGYAALVPDAMEMSDACGGHAALFAVLASQAASHGVASTVARTTSLDAWLERQLALAVPQEHTRALLLAALLNSGTETELFDLGVARAGMVLDELSRAIPLLACGRDESGVRHFRVHDLLDGFLVDRRESGLFHIPADSFREVADVLTQRGDFSRAAELLTRARDHAGLASWLDEYGRNLLSAGCYKQLARLVEVTPVHELMASPKVLMLWADLCCEVGEVDEALAKCQAARSLAEHEGDLETTRRAISLEHAVPLPQAAVRRSGQALQGGADEPGARLMLDPERRGLAVLGEAAAHARWRR